MVDDGITPPAEGEETATGTATATINNPPMIAQSEILNDVLSDTLDEDSNANYNSSLPRLWRVLPSKHITPPSMLTAIQ